MLKVKVPWRRVLIGVPLSAMISVIGATLLYQVHHCPTLASIKESYRSSDRAVLDRHGRMIDEIRVDRNVRRLNWIALEQLPPAFVQALLKAEDRRFYYHPGVDPFSLVKASVSRLTGRTPRGASTITMQLAELIEKERHPSAHMSRRNPEQKLRQMLKAVTLELSWRKRDILEAYVNLIQYRSELQGIAAASFGLFDKAPQGLTRPESAVLAALVRSPNAEVTRVRERACGLLANMGAKEECAFLTQEHLAYLEQGYRIRPFVRLAPHVAKRLGQIHELSRSNWIRATLDRDIQWTALHALQKQITSMESQNMSDGGAIVIENSTGNVLAYVGNIGEGSKAPYVDAVSAYRQAGSALKPFLYARAIDERILTPATVLEDSPLAIAAANGVYRPHNFDRTYRNLVTVRTALAASLNIPAVRALELLTVESFVRTLDDLGISNLETPDFYGPSLALGSADVRLLELANAYRTFANDGKWSPLKFSPDVTSDVAPRQVFSPQAAFIIKNILSDRQARAGTFGLENTLSTRFWTAVKTGTSKDMRDNWAVGFSERYTVGVWTGNFSGEPMWNVTGVQGAAPVWQEIMNSLHEREGSSAPWPPEGVIQTKVHFEHDQTTRDEWFIAGTEPSTETIRAAKAIDSHISYPLNESMIALDPDIPRRNHRVMIQVVAPKQDQNLYMNGHRLGRAQPFVPWEPEAGPFTLELRDSNGLVVDKVHFQVRGRRFAMAKSPNSRE